MSCNYVRIISNYFVYVFISSASKNEDVLYPGLFHERLLNDDGQIIGQERKTIIYASEKKSYEHIKTYLFYFSLVTVKYSIANIQFVVYLLYC